MYELIFRKIQNRSKEIELLNPSLSQSKTAQKLGENLLKLCLIKITVKLHKKKTEIKSPKKCS